MIDSESDPFESSDLAIARRVCPECGARAGHPCVLKRRESRKLATHERRRRVPQPFIWGCYGGPSGEEYHEFDSVFALVEFLRTKKHLVYAHNGGKFDYHYLRGEINTDEPISIICGRLSRFHIGECEFRDSMNILPVALKVFEKDTFDYRLLEPEVRDIPENREKIRKYLRSDCVNLYRLVSAHRTENGVTLTQAGASMKKWTRMASVKPPRQTAARYHQYKPYYYGGRVQCFEQGAKRERFKVIDINSAYPEAMLHAHPYSPAATVMSHLPPEGQLQKCMVTLKCTARGCFPFRLGDDPTKGDLFFPHDERTVRTYNVTGYELMTALELDAVKNISIERVHYFQHSITFEEYILSNWDKRAAAKAAGNEALDIIYKLLMNSLYGKFASDYSKYREFQIAHLDDLLHYRGGLKLGPRGWEKDKLGPWDVDPAVWAEGKRLISRKIAEDKHRYYNIATAASITGFVRAKLFRALCEVERPLYCDTDSIACVDTAHLPLGKGLGQWKVEGDFDRWAIAGKKTYAFHKAGAPLTFDLDGLGEYEHWKVACKGVDLDPDQVHATAIGESIVYSPAVPTYSVKRAVPTFIDRVVKMTAKDIRRVPEVAV